MRVRDIDPLFAPHHEFVPGTYKRTQKACLPQRGDQIPPRDRAEVRHSSDVRDARDVQNETLHFGQFVMERDTDQ